MSVIGASGPAPAFPLLVKQLLLTPLTTRPGQEIVCGSNVRYDYRALRDRIGRLLAVLQSIGVKPGDTVAVMDWDTNRYLECYFAIPMMGAVLMTVNIRLAPEQIAYTLAHSGARFVLVNREFLPVLDSIASQAPELATRVLLDDEAGPLPAGCTGEYEALMHSVEAVRDFPDFDENTRATTFYTSGTTGLPKGVFYSHRQLVLHTLSGMAALASACVQGRLHRDDVYMPITPMFHAHAWGLPYIATLMGLKQVYPGRYTPAGLLRLIGRENVSFSHCVPTILHMLLSDPASAGVDLRGWKVIIGGSALPSGLAQQALDRGVDAFGAWGMSETGPILTLAQVDTAALDDPERSMQLRTKAGIPIPLVDLRIVDDAMDDVPHDGLATGEAVVRSPWLTQGYVHDAEASDALWAGDYLHTNDVANMDPDGYLRITDRTKDVIKSGGEWISSVALEDLISRHPGVAEVAVIGIPDEKWGERPLALVVRRGGVQVEVEDVQALLQRHSQRGQISRYAVPELVIFVDGIARTSVGKIDKKRLRAELPGIIAHHAGALRKPDQPGHASESPGHIRT